MGITLITALVITLQISALGNQKAEPRITDVPGAIATRPETINPAGAIVGFFVDKKDAAHGFLRTP